MASWAKPGVKCVCIAPPGKISNARSKNPWASYPEAGGTYTVRGVVLGTDGSVNLLLEEVRNPPKRSTVGVVEWGFLIKHFRPLITKTQEQDIALFKHHLIESSTHIDA